MSAQRTRAATRSDHSNHYMLLRFCSLVLLSILLISVPAVPGARFHVAALLIFFAIPGTALTESKARPENADFYHSLVDTFSITVASLLMPEIWHATMVVMASLAVASLLRNSNRRTLTLVVLGSSSLFFTGWLHQTNFYWVSVIAFLAIFPALLRHKVLADQQLTAAQDNVFKLVSAANAILWEFNVEEQRLVSVTGRTEELLGLSPTEMMEQRFTAPTEGDLLGTNHRGEREVLGDLKHRDGTLIPFRHLFSQAEDANLRGISFDATRDVEAATMVRHEAEHDALTGLFNRAKLMARLSELFDSGSRRLTDSIALLILDLNRFKEVNDSLGHPVGDELLQEIGRRLLALRQVDMVARLGGDEFAVLMAVGTSRREAVEMAQRVVHVVGKPVELADITLSVTASVGVALTPEHANSHEELIRCADAAMFEAKRHRLGLKVYEERHDDQFSLERLTLTNSMSAALDRNEFELWFQPKVAVTTGEIVGAEGLLRWNHPQRGVLSPAHFLEYISLAGEHRRFTQLVLDHGARRIRQSIDEGLPIEIAVNMSALSFFDRDLPNIVSNALGTHGVPGHLLTLEITETDLVEDETATTQTLQAIGELGVGLSIDDFGTGHSSLVRLRHLPVTEVKIDRSFVTNLHRDGTDFIITRSIIELAHQLGHRTVAEGVESVEAQSQLRALGCDFAQGHLYAKAVNSDDFSALMLTWQHGVRKALSTR